MSCIVSNTKNWLVERKAYKYGMLFSSMEKKSWKQSRFLRTIRRGVAVASVGGLTSLVAYFTSLPAEEKTASIVIATTLCLMGEKYLREYWQEK